MYVFYSLWFICKTQINLIIKVYFILKADTFVFDRNKSSRRTLYNSMTYSRGHITPPAISKWKGETSICRISHIFHILWSHIVWITLPRQIKYLKFYSCAIWLPWKQMVTTGNQVWVCLKVIFMWLTHVVLKLILNAVHAKTLIFKTIIFKKGIGCLQKWLLWKQQGFCT